jgi:MFS transporter, FSR family, fosmidomycin resistance protein
LDKVEFIDGKKLFMNPFNLMQQLQFIALIILIGVAHFLVDTMLGIWPIYKSLAQLDMAKAGLIVAIGAFIGEGSQLFFGSYSDKGYRKILIIGGLILAMASSFLVYSSEVGILFILYLVTCIGSGSFHPCAASLMNQLVPSHRGLLMAIFAVGGSLGLATSQMIFTKATIFFEGHTFYLALPAIGLAFLLACYPFPQVNEQKGTSPKGYLKDFVEFFKTPALRSLYLSQVANQSILWGTIFILPDALKVLGHADWICYGGGHFCFIMGAAFMMIPAGYLADLYSARHVMLYGGIISCCVFYFFLFFGGISQTILLSSLFVLGSTLALMNPIAVSLGNRLEPARSGAVSAFLMGLVWCLSESLGPGGVGLMSALFDDYAAVKALAILGCLFLMQIYATMCLPKKVHAIETKRAF